MVDNYKVERTVTAQRDHQVAHAAALQALGMGQGVRGIVRSWPEQDAS